MKNVELKFNDIWVDVEDGWLCIGDDENQILLRPEYFKKLLEAINYTRCCTELPIKEDDTEYWVDLVNWESGGIEEVSNNNLLEFKKDIDVEIQRRLKK